MKKSRFLSLALAGLMLVGCQPKKAEEKKEEKKVEATKTFEGKTLKCCCNNQKNTKKLFDKFSEETKAKVEFLSMSSGEVIAKIKAEGGKPSADVWFGGGIDAFMKAKEDGLLQQ